MAGRLMLLCLLLAGGVPAAAQDGPYKSVGGWSIYRNDGNCAAYTTFQDDEMVGFSYDASNGATRISFTNIDATSLKKNDRRPIDIVLLFPAGTMDNMFESSRFNILVGDDGRRMFTSQWMKRPALSDLKNALTIGFFYKERKIASYSLKGTAVALKEVERCSMDLHNINPRDVFAGE